MTVSSGGASAARSAGSSPSARWHVRQVVLVAELVSQDKVALPVLVEDFGERGAYLTYEARCSLRFRIHQVHSEEGDLQGFAPPPVMSALYFD